MVILYGQLYGQESNPLRTGLPQSSSITKKTTTNKNPQPLTASRNTIPFPHPSYLLCPGTCPHPPSPLPTHRTQWRTPPESPSRKCRKSAHCNAQRSGLYSGSNKRPRGDNPSVLALTEVDPMSPRGLDAALTVSQRFIEQPMVPGGPQG